MKKLITFLLIAIALCSFYPDRKPTGAGVKWIQSPVFFYNQTDSAVYVNMGAVLGWVRLDMHHNPMYFKMMQGSDTVIRTIHKLDTLSLTGFLLKADSVGLKGWVSKYHLEHKLDSIRNLAYTKHVADSLLLLKVDTINNHSLIRNSLRDSIPTALFKKDSILFVTPYRLLQSLPVGYELEIVTAGVTVLSLPFTLSDRTLVFYNGSVLSKNLWSGVGISTITLMLDTKQKDLLKIQNQ